MAKKNILVITPFPLYPADSGGRIGVLSSIEPLSDLYNYHLLACCTRGEIDTINAHRDEMYELYYEVFQSITFVDRPKMPHEMSKLAALKHLVFHAMKKLPLMDVSYYSADMVKEAKRIVKERHIDAIEVHHLHMAFIRRYFKRIPSILVNHNLETNLFPFWDKTYKSLGATLWNAFGKLSRKNGYAVEMTNKMKFDYNAFVSIKEMEHVKHTYGKKVWLPTSFEINEAEKKFNSDRVKLLWVGGFNWQPNVEAADWFMRFVWPQLSETSMNIEVDFIGENPPPELMNFHDDSSIRVHGYVKDIEDFWKNADVFIVPLLSGGGIRVKILEAMNAGIPVVSTTKGCEGLPYVYGEHLMATDDPGEFAKFIQLLADSVMLRERFSRKGREYVSRNHSKERIASTKQSIYSGVFGEQ